MSSKNPSSNWQTRQDQLTKTEEHYQLRLDRDLQSLASNFTDLIRLTGTEGKDAADLVREKLEIDLRSENLVKSVESLLSLTRELKDCIIVNDVKSFNHGPTSR